MSKELNLYPHNKECVQEINASYANGEDILCCVRATGTGKLYIALEIALERPNSKILYFVPSVSIIEHINETIEEEGLSIEEDFANLSIRTYQSIISLSKSEIANLACDFLIVDEMHHLGAPVWGERIKELINTHKNIKVLGLSAYTVRDRGTSYERDIAEIGGNELFSDKIINRYDIYDALIDGVLPMFIYKSVVDKSKIDENFLAVNELLEKSKITEEERKKYLKDLKAIKQQMYKSKGIKELLLTSIKPNGKYYYFCPPYSIKGVNDIESIKKETMAIFKEKYQEEDIIFYTSTREMKEEGRKNRKAFYNDKTLDGKDASDKLQIMFCINQYNEGTHAPNVDGIIMGRFTSSDIVFFEQLGRGIAVRGHIKEEREKLTKLSLDEIKRMCEERNILVKDKSKERLVEELLAPVVIDLAGNYEYIEMLQNNITGRIKEYNKTGKKVLRNPNIINMLIETEVYNRNMLEMLKNLKERLSMTWDSWYTLATKYYKVYGDLEVSRNFKTKNGYEYDESGYNLGMWIMTQRYRETPETRRGGQLLKIGMRFAKKRADLSWDNWYALATKYYEFHGDLEVLHRFKTTNGYDYDESGYKLGAWIVRQRQTETPETKKGGQLLKIGIRFESKNKSLPWDNWYALATKYYEVYGDLEIPYNFKTINGYEKDESGYNLGFWIEKQRKKETPETQRGEQLLKIGMRFENKQTSSWDDWYALATKYYEVYGDLEVPIMFKTKNGQDYDESGYSLRAWIASQRIKESPETQRGQQLLKIGMRFEKKRADLSWADWYGLATKYYEYNGDLEIPFSFKTKNGYEYDESGYNLGMWIKTQRRTETPETQRGEQLLKIGMRFENKNKSLPWDDWYALATKYYEVYGDLEVPKNFKTKNGYEYDESGYNLGMWIMTQRRRETPETQRGKQLLKIGMRFIKKVGQIAKVNQICSDYGIDITKNIEILNHITVQELLAKILFLDDRNIPLVNGDGLLNQIFRMANYNMQKEFGVSLEELITKYYIEKGLTSKNVFK